MEQQHPIEGLMRTTLESIKNMVDVNTILGDPVETPDGKVIIPISRVTFGFAAGGTEYEVTDGGGNGGGRQQSGDRGQGQQNGRETSPQDTNGKDLPFGGGSGAGISIQPVGFLIVGKDEMRLLPVDGQVVLDRLIDMAPKVLDGLQNLVAKGRQRDGGGELQGDRVLAKEKDKERHSIQAHRFRRAEEEYPS